MDPPDALAPDILPELGETVRVLQQARLTPIEALKAITLWGAYQHFDDKTRGSIEVGKLADLVILDRNPMTVDPATINKIQVMETIKEGKTVCARP